MRRTIAIAVSSFALIALSACNKPEPAANNATANTTLNAANAVAESETGNIVGNAGDPIVNRVYACKSGKTLDVTYNNSADSTAALKWDGKDYVLKQVPSGSGARYEAEEGPTPGKFLAWWNKGLDGMLIEGKADAPDDDKTLESCTEKK